MSEEGTPVMFGEMEPAWRVYAVEDVRRRLLDLAAEISGQPSPEDPPLSPPAEVWLRRMRSALCDREVSTKTISEMKDAFCEALPEAESAELRRRLREFVACRDVIPLTATDAGPLPREARRLLETGA